jgi:hypothetical protein
VYEGLSVYWLGEGDSAVKFSIGLSPTVSIVGVVFCNQSLQSSAVLTPPSPPLSLPNTSFVDSSLKGSIPLPDFAHSQNQVKYGYDTAAR